MPRAVHGQIKPTLRASDLEHRSARAGWRRGL